MSNDHRPPSAEPPPSSQPSRAGPPPSAEPPPSGQAAAAQTAHVDAHRAGRAALTLAALGVVFGDIGTSPLYAVQTIFTADNHAVTTAPDEVYGVISMIFWAITIVVSIKYVTFILRADNNGEGGIMALTALLQRHRIRDAARQGHPDHARHHRRFAVLRRRDHHPGDFGALGGRGPQSRRAQPQRVRGPDLARGPYRAVSGPALRDQQGRWRFRSDHGVVVRHAGRGRSPRSRRKPGNPQGAVAVVCRGLHHQPWNDRVHRARVRGARDHRSGGLVRRHGPLRALTDPQSLVRPRVSGAHPQLSGARRAGAAHPQCGGKPLLHHLSGMGAHADGLPGHDRYRDRIPGGDFRRVQRQPSGRPARDPAAPDDQAHVSPRARPDLRAGHQLGTVRGGDRARHRLRVIGVAGLGVRHRR